MTMTMSEEPRNGSSAARPAVARWRLRVVLTAVIGAVMLTANVAPPATAQTSSPTFTALECITKTKVESFTATGGPFMGGTRLDWHVTSPCPEVQVTINGVWASRIGTVIHDPEYTTTYELFVSMGSQSKFKDYQVVLGGDIVGYTIAPFGTVSDPKLWPEVGGAAKAKQVARQITNTLSKEVKQKLTGKTLEVHIIPAATTLTKLAPWKSLAGKMTCDITHPDGKPNPDCVHPRPWSSVRGVGGTHYQPGKVAVAVGEETLVAVPNKPSGSQKGHTLAHELGHAILDFGAPHEVANVTAILKGNPANHDYMGDDSYTKSTPGEYFAEGTAGMFGYEYNWTGEYNQPWLKANEPKLFTILARIYPGAV